MDRNFRELQANDHPLNADSLCLELLEDFIRQSIIDPNAYIQQGFPKVRMPPFATLPKAQLDALVQYLVVSSKGGK